MQSISSANIVDLLLDAVCIVQPDSTIVFVSPAFERIFGYTPAEAVGLRMLELVHPDDLQTTKQEAQRVMDGQLQLQFENRYLRKDGSVAHIRWTARWLPDRQLRLAVAHDITERKREETMRTAIYEISEAAHTAQTLDVLFGRIHAIIERLLHADHFLVALRDEDSGELDFPYHHARRVDPASAAAMTASEAQIALCHETIRQGVPLLVVPPFDGQPPEAGHESGAAPCALAVPLTTPRGVVGALVLQSHGGRGHYVPNDKELLQFVSTQVASAIDRKQMHERLTRMAQYDQLTQLPNRQLFLDRLRTALARAQRDFSLLALLFIDLDRFKDVNDTLGHATGDLMLQQVAQRLRASVRASDTVARLGGDEFVVLLEGGHARDHSHAVAHKILAAFAEPFELEGRPLGVQLSIGVAFYPDHGADEHHLLTHADSAMYVSKKGGGNQVHVADTLPGSAPP
jgi:diguanylate cyclase (GGDEF)-like protein/PAS domain S-box-containing protein